MNIKGLFDYDRLKLAKDNLETEIVMAKITATELTKENDDLHQQNLDLQQEILQLKKDLQKLKEDNKVKWHFSMIQTNQGLVAGWIPTDGSTVEIISRYPAIFPEYTQTKQVPER